MLEVPNEKAEVVSNATIYAVKILNEVKASYAAFAEKDFGTDSDSFFNQSNNIEVSDFSSQNNTINSNVVEPKNENIPEPNCLALVVRRDNTINF